MDRVAAHLGIAAAIAACLAASVAYAAAPAGLACTIAAEPGPGGGYRLTPTVSAAQPASGTYAFRMAKRDRAGSSTSRQSGSFTLPAGGERALSTLVVSLAPGGTIEAHLTLKIGEDSVECDSVLAAP